MEYRVMGCALRMGDGSGQGEREHPRAGFTLIELVIVLALITLLTAISYPLLQHWTEAPLRRGARQMTAVIEQLFERAVMTRQIYRLRLEVAGDRYWVEVLQPSEEAAEFVALPPERSLPSGVRIRDLVTARQATVTNGEAAVYFYPIGRLDQVVLHLEQRDGRVLEDELSLIPHPLTGRVAVTEGYVIPAS
ncbi:MAG: prepilin-type N-terminal cleavage/methylation domain-containing protein [Nitrospirota bacterium]